MLFIILNKREVEFEWNKTADKAVKNGRSVGIKFWKG